MFTGIVETLGRVAAVQGEEVGVRLIVDSPLVSGDAQMGDSICINGCCLTVVDIDQSRLSFQAGEETLSRTNLGRLQIGDGVNLERSLRASDRLGGHWVTGHVDGLGQVERRQDDGAWCTMWFRPPPELMLQLAPKGSVAVDGVSLTVVDVTAELFSVALIPHTLEQTTLGVRQEGDAVNLESDVLAKYVQRQFEALGGQPT